MNPLIQSLTEGQLRTDIPAFRPGDTANYFNIGAFSPSHCAS